MLALPGLSYLHTGERLVLDGYDVEDDDCTPVDPEDLDEAMIVLPETASNACGTVY